MITRCKTVLDLQALPEGCIANIISFTTPRDACRLSSLSRIFMSAAESDTIWFKFIPPEIHSPLSPLYCLSKSKKELYLALCDSPALIDEGKMSLSLDKWSGKKCYMISARSLQIIWSDTPQYWRWISFPDTRFEEVAELLGVWWLEISGKIDRRMMSPSTLYKAYLVYRLTAMSYGFECQSVEVTVGGESNKRIVFLEDAGRIKKRSVYWTHFLGLHAALVQAQSSSQPREIELARQYPKERADGWLEIELGEFFCEGGEEEDGELEMTCSEINGAFAKGGLIVQGIEVRPNRI
ncbi:F-box protein PP2-B10-like [Rosa rugosa]|uniref:F-box protein PP2-B10-like n=1 Tax=Rosa rugosa TaxID=74645 RepID=UPI002B4051D7|nr:F-box protein PP2-B10-like [Rosa rugosa]